MIIKKIYLTVLFLAITNICIAGITEKYSKTLTTEKGFTFKAEPVTYDEKYLRDKSLVAKEPSNAKFMRDGKPWPDNIIKNTHLVYAASWEIFDDLKKGGITTTKPLTLSFILYDESGNVVGDGGIQIVKHASDAEIFFNVMPAYRRKGVGYTLSKYLIEFFKTHFKDDKIGASVMPDNVASKSLLRKLGMVPKCDKSGKPITYHNPVHNKKFDIFIMKLK